MASMHHQDEQSLLALILQGDQQALDVLYERYSASVFNLASYVLRNREMAEEVTQDVFILLWRKPEQWNAALGVFGSWLLSVTRHIAIDRLRSEIRHTNDDGVSLDDVAEQVESAVGASTQIDDLHFLTVLLGELPADQKQVLSLVFFQALTHDEIAQRLKIPVGTVKSRLRLALTKLRSRWQEQATPNHSHL